MKSRKKRTVLYRKVLNGLLLSCYRRLICLTNLKIDFGDFFLFRLQNLKFYGIISSKAISRGENLT